MTDQNEFWTPWDEIWQTLFAITIPVLMLLVGFIW